MRRLIIAGAIALSLSPAAHAVELVCGQPKVFVGDEPNDQNPVSSIEIIYKKEEHSWLVFHHHVNGLVAARAQQYAMEDNSNNGRTGWAGSLNRNRSLYMVGEAKVSKTDPNDIIYVEQLYNRSQNNRLDMQMAAHCTIRSNYAAMPAYQAPVPVAPAAPVIMQAPAPIIIMPGAAPQVQAPAPQAQSPVMAYEPPKAAATQWPQQTVTTKRDAVPIYPGNQGMTIRVDVLLGGQPVRMMLDTGATTALIPTDLARKIVASGNGEWQGQVKFRMADGTVRDAYVVLIKDVRIGTHTLHNVRAGVADGDDLLLDFPTVNQIGPFMIDTRNQQLVFNP